MKRRIYLIAALALINIVIMKYNEFKGEKKGNTLAITENEGLTADSLLSSSHK
ncbi:MAG: hypothetical protein WC756_03090 [Taibaiella sp.]|jgi:hypothetical protein